MALGQQVTTAFSRAKRSTWLLAVRAPSHGFKRKQQEFPLYRTTATSAGSLDRSATATATSDNRRRQSSVSTPMDETVRYFLNPAHFFALLKSHGTSFYAGVPDSLLKDFCAYITDIVPKKDHVIAVNEGTALATAAGHYQATGKIPLVYLQNSDLGKTANPLLSLCNPKVYAIPTLLLIGWRGEPGKKDEPQHSLQSAPTPGMLREMGIPFDILPDYPEGAFEVLDKAYKHMNDEKRPYALLVRKDTFEQKFPI